MHYTFFICVCILILVFGVYTLFMYQKKALKNVIVTCFLTIVLNLLLFAIWPIPSFYFDIVNITASGECSDVSNGNNVMIKGVRIHSAFVKFPDIKNGQWFWENGTYNWLPQYGATDNIDLKIPVGKERQIIFQGTNDSGLVKLALDDFSVESDLYSEQSKSISINIPDSKNKIILKNELFRILCFSLINIILLCFACISTKVFSAHKLFKIIQRYKYELTFFLMSLFMIIRYGCYPNLVNYQSSFYVKGYEFGFVKRGLIGAIFTHINSYISQEYMVLFKLVFLLLFFLLLSWFLGAIIKWQSDEKMRWFLLLFVISMPSTFIFVPDDLRLDIFVFIVFALASFLIAKNCLVEAVPVLSFNMLLINETSCTFFLLPILSMLLYKFIKCGQVKYLVSMVTTLCLSAVVCIVFLFRKDPWLVYDINQIISHLQQHAGFTLDSLALGSETWTFARQIQFYLQQVSQNYKNYILFLLIILPALILFFKFFTICYKEKVSDTSSLQKLTFWFVVLSPLSAFLPMIISIDFPRYASFMFNAFFVILFFILYEEKNQITYDMLSLGVEEVTTLNVWPIAICIFYICFGMFASTVHSTATIVKFVSFFSALLGI